MRLTIELPDDLHREAKALASKRGLRLKDIVREALEEELAREGAVFSTDENDVRHPN
jgi:predicted transcriptional regulator